MVRFYKLKPRGETVERNFTVAGQRVQQEQPLDSLGMTQRVRGADQASPILNHKSDVLQIESIYQSCQIFDMRFKGILTVTRSRAFSEPHMVGHDDPMTL